MEPFCYDPYPSGVFAPDPSPRTRFVTAAISLAGMTVGSWMILAPRSPELGWLLFIGSFVVWMAAAVYCIEWGWKELWGGEEVFGE